MCCRELDLILQSAAEIEEEEDDAPKSKAAKGGKADKKATQSKPKPVPNQPPADDGELVVSSATQPAG